jgi:ribosomal peptide maturation radical SAM protein 1
MIMPINVALVCMPFASHLLPSIGLTQLKAVTETAADRRVSISYLNHEFCRMLGHDLYSFVGLSDASLVTGMGDWLFRNAAFPELSDNTAAYFSRYAHHFAKGHGEKMRLLLEERKGLNDVLDELIVRYRLHDADVVGLTSMFFQNLPSIALARRLRHANPDQIIIMGGANCEASMGVELVTNVPVIDFVFSGCSLVSFPKFIDCLVRGDSAGCHQIDGVFSRKNSRSVSTMITNTDEVDWSRFNVETQLREIKSLGQELSIHVPIELDYDSYLESVRRLLPHVSQLAGINFETSRGCWWGERAHCTFCGLNGGTMAYRAMRPDHAVNVFQRLFDQYGDRVNIFDAVDNIMPIEYITGVIEKIKPPPNASIFYEVKSDLTEEQTRILSHGHVRRIQPGIEALSTATLKLMRKGTTAFHGINLLTYCKRYDVTPYWNLLVGFPKEAPETYETYAKVLPSLTHLPPPSGVFTVRFDRFSPYFSSARDYGLKLAPYDFYSMCYPFPSASLFNMAYYFQDTNHDAQYIQDAALWTQELEALTASWRKSWQRADAAPKLEMHTEATGTSIDDTRGSAPNRYYLSSAESNLLKTIRQPTRESSLNEQDEVSLHKFLSWGLIFSERGKVLSLVSPAEQV